MKLIDGIKEKGGRIEINDCSRDDLPGFFKEMGFKVGAEVGVYLGRFSRQFCEQGFNKFYAIDPWEIYDDYDNPQGKGRMDAQYNIAKELLNPYANCTIIRKTSMDALADIPNGSLDFVYIDGNHLFKYVAQDICEWFKKVRPGGIVSGHDYFHRGSVRILHANHVRWVLDAFVKAYDIDTFYVLGRHRFRDGEKRDKWRSWMFIKK